MPDSRKRKAKIRERMAATGLDWIPASKAVGVWWEQNRKGQSPRPEFYGPKEQKNGG